MSSMYINKGRCRFEDINITNKFFWKKKEFVKVSHTSALPYYQYSCEPFFFNMGDIVEYLEIIDDLN